MSHDINLEEIANPICPNETVYSLPEIAKSLVDGNLWVVDSNLEGCHIFYFLSFVFSDDEQTGVEVFMRGHGYPELKECRHTHWGDEGYIYFPRRDYFVACLDYLKTWGYEL